MVDSRYELTAEEQELLGKYSRFYRALETGARTPTTEAQKHFVAMCEGLAVAETPHERAWAKYMRHRAKQTLERFEESQNNRDIPEFEDGYPRPGWFTDEDWRKLRSRDYADMKSRHRG